MTKITKGTVMSVVTYFQSQTDRYLIFFMIKLNISVYVNELVFPFIYSVLVYHGYTYANIALSE